MNPFVNPNKRSITLPSGCKDLVDVIKKPKSSVRRSEAIQKFIRLLLTQAEKDQASEVLFESTSKNGNMPITYRVKDKWFHLSEFPVKERLDLLEGLYLVAKETDLKPSGEIFYEFEVEGQHSKWKMIMAWPDGECRLIRC